MLYIELSIPWQNYRRVRRPSHSFSSFKHSHVSRQQRIRHVVDVCQPRCRVTDKTTPYSHPPHSKEYFSSVSTSVCRSFPTKHVYQKNQSIQLGFRGIFIRLFVRDDLRATYGHLDVRGHQFVDPSRFGSVVYSGLLATDVGLKLARKKVLV